MLIKNVKINGIKNPVGFKLNNIILSYYVCGIPEGCFEARIYSDAECKNVCFVQPLNYSENYCAKLNFVPERETRYYLKITCEDAESEPYYFETGTVFDCPFITPETDISHPVISKEFNSEPIEKARLYITGLGIYSATINGRCAGNEYLTPGCNDYDAYVQYQTYDVTDLISGRNIIEITLGKGWYKGRFGLKHKENIYGSEYVCAAKLVLWSKSGKKHVVATDESWFARRSNVIDSGIYDGEIVDDTACDKKVYGVRIAGKKPVIERISLPIVVKERIKPSLIVSPKGEKILDFGQNFAGFVSFCCDLKRGDTVRLQAGETLQNGCFYRDNLRTAKAEFIYTSDGIKKEVYPRFTFFGFRYMLVEGINDVYPDDFTGNVIYSDLDETAFVDTDNDKINRLILNCKWGQKSNFIDVPTDCPQRDERLGWTGDAEVFCSAACYQFDCRAFYSKYCKDMAIDQEKLGGWISSYSPSFKELEEAGSAWIDAATIIPWTMYEFYGDKYFLKSTLPLIEDFVDKLISRDNANGGGRLFDFGFQLGDWLSQDGLSRDALRGATNEYFISSCYYYNSVKIAALAEKELGNFMRADKYLKISEEIKAAVLNEYFTPSGRLAIDTQTAYVLCVTFGIYREKSKLLQGFSNRLKKDGYAVKGGFVGATKLIQALLRSGLTDDAFRILYSEKFPGWLYCVNLGATTVWERWNSLNDDGTISGSTMNSLNHYSFGAVAEAFYRDIAGIIPTAKAFKSVIISPKFNYRLKRYNCKLITVAGEFELSYGISAEGRVKGKITVPFGVRSEAELFGEKTHLHAGENEFETPPQVALIHPFSLDSILYDIMANKESAAVLGETLPEIYRVLSSGDMGFSGLTLRALCTSGSFPLPKPTVDVLDRRLREIKI